MSGQEQNEYLQLVDMTSKMIDQIKFARRALRKKSRINRKYLTELLRIEKTLFQLREHLKNIPDDVDKILD